MGKPVLCVLTCGNFRPELEAAVRVEGWDDVVVRGIPARCGRPPLNWDEVAACLPEGCEKVLILGRACLQGLGGAPRGMPPVHLVPHNQCFHLLAGETLVDEAVAAGGYLITPAWLANWEERLAALGFTPEMAGECFREFARELVYLDTGIAPEATARLPELASTLKIPARRVPVGLDHARQRLARLVFESRLEREVRSRNDERQRHSAELADHVAAMDLLQRLARTQTEAEAVTAIQELFQMLFAPSALHYLRLENDLPEGGEDIPEELRQRLLELGCDYDWLDADRTGFLLRIRQGEKTLGLAAVVGLAFPAYHQRYLNLALAVTGVCGLAIENARNRKRLLEAEKMASLGIVVAGVAHEVNTPLGVCMASSSKLAEQSRHLTERFNGRTMTQSDLRAYLGEAATCTELTTRNLERIGQLVDAFRRVAVQGKRQEYVVIRLRDCLDEVIRSFGQRLPAESIQLDVRCPEDIEVSCVHGDWTTIFMNLISNSLKHGFRGRSGGGIGVEIWKDGSTLMVDYRDSGAGMTPEAREHIFDPFFTTDMQKGMGLGMHLVYNLVTHRLGGSIQCQSELGAGARFLIRVPLDASKEA